LWGSRSDVNSDRRINIAVIWIQSVPRNVIIDHNNRLLILQIILMAIQMTFHICEWSLVTSDAVLCPIKRIFKGSCAQWSTKYRLKETRHCHDSLHNVRCFEQNYSDSITRSILWILYQPFLAPRFYSPILLCTTCLFHPFTQCFAEVVVIHSIIL
jgi:hypothetical protein